MLMPCSQAGHDWMMIYNDSRHETYIGAMNTPNAARHTFNMDEFFHRARKGTLPALTWIGPREGVNASLGPLGAPPCFPALPSWPALICLQLQGNALFPS